MSLKLGEIYVITMSYEFEPSRLKVKGLENNFEEAIKIANKYTRWGNVRVHKKEIEKASLNKPYSNWRERGLTLAFTDGSQLLMKTVSFTSDQDPFFQYELQDAI